MARRKAAARKRRLPKKKIPKSKPEPPRSFLDLPAEIRQMVYELCLITDRVIRPFVVAYEADEGVVPYSAWDKQDKLATGLLATNSLIRAESRRVLFSRNTWFLSGRYDKHWSPPFCGAGHETSSLWRANIDLFRSVEVSFDFRDADNSCRRRVMEAVFRQPRIPSQSPDYCESRTRLVHNLLLSTLFLIWITKLRLVRQMSLSSLVVHLSECCCPGSCCRLEKFVLRDPFLMRPWHRSVLPEDENNLSRPPSLRRNTYLSRDAVRGWGDLATLPQNLDKIRFQVICDKNFSPDSIHSFAHEVGLGCLQCPLIDGKPQPKDCTYLDNFSV